MVSCKNCHQNNTIKNGYVRSKQRYKCNNCGYNFVLGDARHKQATELKKALSIILYSLGKSSFGFLGKLFVYHARPLIIGFAKSLRRQKSQLLVMRSAL